MTIALELARASARAPFASVEVFADLGAAGAAYAALAARAGGYQTPAFVEAWARAFGARLLVAVARDETGAPVVWLPLHVVRRGPLMLARFAGDSWANYQFGLFRDPEAWRPRDLRALFAQVGRAASVDLFALDYALAVWEGAPNPIYSLPGVVSPSPAFATRLGASQPEWLDAHFSRDTQKKLRKKLKKLEAFGPVAHRRAADAAEATHFLEAMLAHKAEQSTARGEADLFAEREVRDLLRRLAAGEAACLEMHALLAGERVVAAMGALPGGRRLSGLVISYDGSPEIAAATPGVQLVAEVARDARERGFTTLDLGVGEARYKRETCEIEETLRDVAIGVTLKGRLGAALYLGARRAMGAVKRRPELYARALKLKRWLKPTR